MANNTTLSPGAGGDTIRDVDKSGVKTPVSLLDVGGAGAEALVGDAGVAMPVAGTGTAGSANAGVVTVQGVAAMTPVQVGDGGGSLTVDAPAGTPVFVRLSDGAAAITALPVTDSGGSLTVDGTVAATQSGAWTVGISAAQTVAVTNAGTFAVQAAQSGTWNVTNVSGTVSLPTGAATAAKQPALGTAGTASADVLTVQGIASMTALKVDGSGVTQPVSGTVTANAGTGTFTISGAVTQSGTWNVGTVTTVTGVTTVTTVSTVTSLTQFNGNAIDTNSGVKSAGTLRVVIATDQPALTNKLLVTADPITFASAQAVTQSGTWTVQPGNTANTTPWLVTDTPATSGGLSKFHLVSAGSTNATNVKALAGQVYCITAFNTNAAARYLKFHNTAGTPTAGSGVTDTFMIPGGSAGAGVVINIDKGIAFGTGIGITLVTGIADADAAGVSASDVVVNIYYK